MKGENNISFTGDSASSLTLLVKLGVILFISGLIGFIIHFKWLEQDLLLYISAFLMTSGAILFTRKRKEIHGLNFHYFRSLNMLQFTGLVSSLGGISILILSWAGVQLNPSKIYLLLSLGGIFTGTILYTFGSYYGKPAGIKNNAVYFNLLTNNKLLGWLIGVVLTLFYIQIYWFEDSMLTLSKLFDPFSWLLRHKAADRWFVYGTLYSISILFLGIKFIVKYRHSNYHIIRTISIILAQLIFAYFIPQILESMNEGTGYFDRDLKNIWPLNYEFASPYRLSAMQERQQFGPSGTFFFVWGLALFLIITPVLTYLVGKRWYCSWVCGCGGLAETAGDSFRHLSSKKIISWKIERWMIHSVMVFVLISTIATLWPYFSGKPYTIEIGSITKTGYFVFTFSLLLLSAFGLWLLSIKHKRTVLKIGAIILLTVAVLLSIGYFSGNTRIFFLRSTEIKKAYGFFIGAIFSGIAGVGFYPVLGNRVWCRFGCPMAAYMGVFQRFKSRFRITTNGGQCISCGNCSTYCEQGIDVRAYAQKGENIIRSSCVGCGICAAVCPRGVLKLENGPEEGRM